MDLMKKRIDVYVQFSNFSNVYISSSRLAAKAYPSVIY